MPDATSQSLLQLNGMARFVRYAFMPNRLEYCGGGDNRALFEYGHAGISDGGLSELVRQFTGALPYLRLIADANRIADAFDSNVVEAYWLGNGLLDGVEVRQLYDHLADRFKKQLQGRTKELILGKAPAGARPHHSFHVLDVYSRLGDLDDNLHTLDSCRISWGRVLEVQGSELVVERQPLEVWAGKLILGTSRQERMLRQIGGKGFADSAAIGDWVSLHWGWVCEVLTEDQKSQLERYTIHHVELANQTL